MEESILLWIQQTLRTPILTPVFQFITALGNAGFIWILISVILLLCTKTRKIGALCSISLVASFVVNNLLLKNIVQRIRPYEMIDQLNILIAAPLDSSFPSGHTASSFAAATVLYLLCPKRYGISALILASLISFSRMYVGVHYPTDVLAGIFSGVVIGVITVYVYNRKRIHF